MIATAALTLAVTAVALVDRPTPRLSQASPWLVADVPGRLWALVLGTAVVAIAVAVAVTVRAAGLRSRDPVLPLWLLLVVIAAAALVWNAVYAAALSTAVVGAIIPIFHWMFTLVPAVLAGVLFIRRGRRARWAAAIGTGVVTLPLFHLGSLLLVSGELDLTVLGSLQFTGLLGVAPLIGGVGIAGALGGDARNGRLPHPFG